MLFGYVRHTIHQSRAASHIVKLPVNFRTMSNGNYPRTPFLECGGSYIKRV